MNDKDVSKKEIMPLLPEMKNDPETPLSDETKTDSEKPVKKPIFSARLCYTVIGGTLAFGIALAIYLNFKKRH